MSNPPAKKILVLKLSSLGDVVHTLPAVRTLRANHPDAFIAWMIEERYRDLLLQNPDVDEVIPVRLKHWRQHWNGRTLGEIRGFLNHLRSRRFDTVIDLHGLIKTGVLAWVSGAPERIGFPRDLCKEKWNTWFTNRRGPCSGPGTHVVDLNLDLVQQAGGKRRWAEPHPFQVPEADRLRVQTFWDAHPELTARPVVGVNPGVGFATKEWTLERFAQLADRIIETLGYSVLLTWGPGEEDKVRRIQERMQGPAWVAPPTSLLESIALYRHLALFVSCDSGPLHLCAGLGIPTVSLFGPTDPARNGAFGPRNRAVHHVLSCSFCWKKRCPLGTRECMDRISVDEVFEAVRDSAHQYVKTCTP
ncbi:MAG: hypothetical protein GWM98_06535 [Nitrospinaceae bacterium]|nr:glycosyltransferase family 9 protein [Nitrospinaceae bacterium]NIR54211.1 glycosyltransferase family 9 protein [Nitrospinaceae bacterium]NIS84626.1 glycosyltransferase family 9 protein [Nitrospinaceae bacterium]NIT81421.1 glycosyltransferase family 9 protein [Nitrospinaceae bacterium]NIU43705.1 glycosyltransferase family 9 protein [Nitrospinaceae bacterium]